MCIPNKVGPFWSRIFTNLASPGAEVHHLKHLRHQMSPFPSSVLVGCSWNQELQIDQLEETRIESLRVTSLTVQEVNALNVYVLIAYYSHSTEGSKRQVNTGIDSSPSLLLYFGEASRCRENASSLVVWTDDPKDVEEDPDDSEHKRNGLQKGQKIQKEMKDGHGYWVLSRSRQEERNWAEA